MNDRSGSGPRPVEQSGIRVHGSFMLGGIRETREMIEQTITAAIRLNPYIVQFTVLTPYPGTALFEDARREGRIVTYRWALYDGIHAVLRGDFLDVRTVQQLLVCAYRKFYIRLARLFQALANLLRRRERIGVLIREIRLVLLAGNRLKQDAGKGDVGRVDGRYSVLR